MLLSYLPGTAAFPAFDLFAGGLSEARAWVAAALPGAKEDGAHFEPVADLLASYLDGARVDFKGSGGPRRASAFHKTRARRNQKNTLRQGGELPVYCRASRRAQAARAVGQALGRNPVPLVIPCHRVIRSDGSLGGFGMGLDVKTKLLSIEGVDAQDLRKSTIFS